MCIASPMRIVSIDQGKAKAECGGVRREISLALLPDAAVGEYVLVHAGFAIGRLGEDEALMSLDELNKAGIDPNE